MAGSLQNQWTDGPSWFNCILNSLKLQQSSEALLGYKIRATPDQFRHGDKPLAFEVSYDSYSKTALLTVQPSNIDSPREIIEFKDTTRHFQSTPNSHVSGWYVAGCERARDEWGNMRSWLECLGRQCLDNSNKYRRRCFGPQSSVHGMNPLWAIRGYFVGQDENNAPPYVTVLCSDPKVSEWLVQAITAKLKYCGGWYATRLPKVQLLEYVSNDGPSHEVPSTDERDISYEDADEVETRLKIEVRLAGDYPTMVNEQLSSWSIGRHRCGIRIEVTLNSETVGYGTIGGLVRVGGTVYGLTVGHIFVPRDHTTANTGHVIAGAESPKSSAEDVSPILAAWEHQKRLSLKYDWALVEMTGLQHQQTNAWDDLNLVRTVTGDFCPVMAGVTYPRFRNLVLLATPGSTHCLRGHFMGSQAVVNIPSSPTAHAAWVIQMEQPWLIQPGDSGSWAFDAVTGDLLGVLVAGCPEMQEAYILPSRQVFDDIHNHIRSPVSLANFPSIPNRDGARLNRLLRSYSRLEHETSNTSNPVEHLQRFRHEVAGWEMQKSALLNQPPTVFQKSLRGERKVWNSLDHFESMRNAWLATFYRDGHDWQNNESFAELAAWARVALARKPLQCYNDMNKRWRALLSSSPPPESIEWGVLNALWDHMILGMNRFRLQSADELGKYYSDERRVIQKEIRRTKTTSHWYRQSGSNPRDRYTVIGALDIMQVILTRQIAKSEESFLTMDSKDVGNKFLILWIK